MSCRVLLNLGFLGTVIFTWVLDPEENILQVKVVFNE